MRGNYHSNFAYFTTFAFACLAPMTAWAQDYPHGFELTSPLSVSAGYDNNFIVGTQTLSDTVTIVTAPTVAWSTSTRRTVFSLDYEPEFEIFASNSNLDAANHAAHLAFRHKFNADWSLDIGDAFFSTMDSSRTLSNSLILFPRGRFDQNIWYGELAHRLSRRTNLTLRLDSVYTTVAIPELQGGLDNVTGAGTVTVDHSLTSHQQISGSYSFIHTIPVDPAPFRTNSNINVFVGGYSYNLPPGLIVRLTAGGIQGGRQSGFTGSFYVDKKIRNVWVGAGFQRYLGFFASPAPLGPPLPGQIVLASGITPNISYDTFSVRAAGQVTKRVGIEANAQKAINSTDVSGFKIRSLVGQLRVDYRINDRFLLFARVEHYGQNFTFFLPEAISRNRYFGGVEIALSKASGPNGSRFRRGVRKDDNVVVPPLKDDAQQ
jgi:hypothetical protein